MTSSELRSRVGKVFMFGFQGESPSDALRHFLGDRGVGGVIVFTRNARDGAALADLVTEIRALAPEPILIAIDHEGGPVLRLSSGASQLPSAMALSATGNPDRAALAGRIAGAELAAMGVDINLAPVLDVNTNRDNPGIGCRSFGETAGDVVRFALPYLKALQEAGVSATAKHFPGKGSASLDAHFDLPYITRGEADLRSVDLEPFRQAAAAGIDCFMGSHTVYEAFGDQVPATLSRKVMTGMLREELQFPGVLITDDLEMGAIRDHFGFERAIRSSFTAGADQLLICHEAEKQTAAMDLIEESIRSGEISEGRLDESVARVSRLQQKHAVRRQAGSAPLKELLSRHRADVDALWRDSICLLRDPQRSLPLRRDQQVLAVFPELAELSPVDEGSGEDPALPQLMQQALPRLSSAHFTPRNIETPALPSDQVEAAELTLFFSYNAHVDPDQTRLLQSVQKRSKRFVLVALRNPYDLRFARPEDTALASLGFRKDVLIRLSRVLLEGAGAPGRLPAGAVC